MHGNVTKSCGFDGVPESWKTFLARGWFMFVPGFAMEGVPSLGTPGTAKEAKTILYSSS